MDNSSVADYGSIYLNELNTKAEENERADMEETDSEIERNLEGKSLQKEGMKRKLLRTTLIDAAYLGVTLNLGMIGPSLLDLEVRARTTTSQISTVFTWRAVLGLTASLTMGFVLDRVNNYLVVSLMLLADVFFIAVAPWFTSLVPMLATLSPPEFFNSVIGMGTHLMCISIWKEDSGPSLQSLNLMATIGYTLAPLLCKPFISSTRDTLESSFEKNSSLTEIKFVPVTLGETRSTGIREDSALTAHLNLSKYRINPTSEPLRKDTSRIQYAFLIVAMYDLLVGTTMVSLFARDGCRCRSQDEDNTSEKNPQDEEKKTSRKFEVQISALFFVFNLFYGGIEVGYAGLLMTFAVKYLGWSKSRGTDVTAVLQGSNAAITAVAVILARYVKPNHMLIASITLVTASMLFLSIFATQLPMCLWFCTTGLGMGYATIMPSSYTWVNSFMTVSGGFSSAYWSGFFTGFMTIPAFSGYLFQNVHPMFMHYVTLSCGIGMLCVFSVISFLASRKH